ncbi:hypothetical protein [Veillonella rodentium]|uniref:Uncharacterized protein n=1 Tax=Veillonella rodentium TaxID=248315 RepID=A0A239Y8H8_9FIRM|nr:hypothetical protein [Veillonella rodentium]SNV55551.1 Uncharacterised protein [Veillonella rodentium]
MEKELIEKELLKLRYPDQRVLDINIMDLGSTTKLAAETFIIEFYHCSFIKIDNDLMNFENIQQFKNGNTGLFLQNISVDNVTIQSRTGVSNNIVKCGYAYAHGKRFEIMCTMMDIVIECLDFKIIKKSDLERNIESLIHYKEKDQ